MSDREIRRRLRVLAFVRVGFVAGLAASLADSGGHALWLGFGILAVVALTEMTVEARFDLTAARLRTWAAGELATEAVARISGDMAVAATVEQSVSSDVASTEHEPSD